MELEIAASEEVLATKIDLKEAFHALDLKIGEVRGELKGAESRLRRRVFTCLLGQTAVIAGALYFALAHLRR